MNKIKILVEGNPDKTILEYIFEAANFPLDKFEIIVCQGKFNILNFIKAHEDEWENIIALFDSDEANIPDSNLYAQKYVQRITGNVSVESYCAVPSIEAWVFSDDILLKKISKNPKVINRLSLPEEISYPKYTLSQLLKSKDFNLSFLKLMNIERAVLRSPSLKNFIIGISNKIGLPNKNLENVFSRNIDRDIMVNLIKEVTPKDTIVYKTLDGFEYNAIDMETEIKEGSQLGKDYISDVLRLARNFFIKKATRVD